MQHDAQKRNQELCTAGPFGMEDAVHKGDSQSCCIRMGRYILEQCLRAFGSHLCLLTTKCNAEALSNHHPPHQGVTMCNLKASILGIIALYIGRAKN